MPPRRLPWPRMGKGEAVELEAGGRTVRLSNPDKVYFPERGFTKLDVARLLPGRRRRHHARPARPAHHPGALPRRRRRRVLLPEAGPQEPARLDPHGPDRLPQRPHADEICPTEPAAVLWAAQLGCLTFHPWPVRREATDHPDELRIDLDPQPGTDFDDAVPRRPRTARPAGRVGAHGLAQDVRRPRPPRLRPDRTALDVHRGAPLRHRHRPGAGAAHAGPGHHRLVEGGARRADLRRLQPDRPRPHHRLRLLRTPQAARPGLRAAALGRAGRRHPEDFDLRDHARALRRTRRPPRGHGRPAFGLEPLLELADRDERDHGLGDMPYPPDYPKMPGEPKRVQPSRAAKDK